MTPGERNPSTPGAAEIGTFGYGPCFIGSAVPPAPYVPASAHGELRIVERRHPWRQVAAAVAVALFAGALWSLAHNPNVGLEVIQHYLTAPMILRGVSVTLFLTFVAMVLGVLGGVVIAIMRISDNQVLSKLALLYVWAFRGTPLLVQLIFWAYAGAIFPTIAVSVPFTDIVLWSATTADLINPLVAALLALTLNEAAYAAEIIRAGFISVDHGQTEAAYSLGMGQGRTIRRIVLPQAMRTIIPPMGSQVISMLKATSLVSVIGGQDLMTTVQYIYSENFKVIPLLIVASLWYLLLTSLLSMPQRWLEQRYGRGAASGMRS